MIPKDTDILLTHGPPCSIGDKTIHGNHEGCVDLLNAVRRVKPKYHLFGHIHEAYGIDKIGDTIIVNPGPARHDRCAIVDFNERIKVQLETLCKVMRPQCR